MLDQNDIQMIAQLLEQQEKKIINQVNAIIETKVTPQIQLIAEQHGDIIARLDKVDQIDGHADRIRTLERVTASHTAEIKELKKAQ
ncbi:hypothetical protein [Anaerotruncus massiliensis (ex Togo et al. 2019)]|uniref:hypothetical protein n=1 Tax=Anaerotruncus TaxID=244127 RepID=UPI0027B8D367|nr:hypothetical protein [Anaerotruncus massiliensis (ex Togo et al. 2019)]